MDNLLKGAENLGSQAVSSVGNLLSGAAHAIEAPFQPQQIQSPVPNPMPQAQTPQPSPIQSLLSSLPGETMGALSMVQNMFHQGVQGAQQTVSSMMQSPIGQEVENIGKQYVSSLLAASPNTGPLGLENALSSPQQQQASQQQALQEAQKFNPQIATQKNGQLQLNPLQYVEGGLKGTGALMEPVQTAVSGLLNIPMQAGMDVLQGKNPVQDVAQNWQKQVAQGIDFGAQLGPLSKAAEPFVNPITSKIALGGASVSDIADALKNGNLNPDEATQLMQTAVTPLTKIASSAISGFPGMAGVGALQPAATPRDRLINALSMGAQGSLFNAGGETVGLGAGSIKDRIGQVVDSSVSHQAGEDIQSEDPQLLNQEAIAPFKPALKLASDPESQAVIADAAEKVTSPTHMGDPEANKIVNTATTDILPSPLRVKNTIEQAQTWLYLFDRMNGRVPDFVPEWMKPFDNAIFEVSGSKALQGGFIKPDEFLPGSKEETTVPPSSSSLASTTEGKTNLSIKDELQQPPLPPRMSSKAVAEGKEVPTRGSDISVSPQAHKRFKMSDFEKEMDQSSNNEPKSVDEILKGGKYATNENTVTGSRGEQLGQANNGYQPPKEPKTEMGEGSNNLWNKIMNPLRNLPKALQDATEKWKAGQDSAQVAANEVNLRIKALVDKLGITPQQEWALVNYSQNPTPEFMQRLEKAGYDISPELVTKAKPILDLHRQLENDRFGRANSAGIPTQYKENHLYQDYANSPSEVEKAMQQYGGRGLNKKPGFTYKREIPTFLDAKELGLQPKYSTFGQLNANAEQELGKSITNKQYADFLKTNNRIAPSSQAPQGWKPILSDNFPRDPETGDHYYASPKDAEVINNIFGGTPKSPVQALLNFTGNLSERLQSTLLTTPGVSVHGFSVANIVRDQAMALGDLVTGHPIRGFNTSKAGVMSALRAFIPGAAENFERDHALAIQQMADRNLGYSGKENYQNMQKNVGAKMSTQFLNSAKKVEDAIVTDPTFRKFMFQRKVSLFENFRDALQSQGFSPDEAANRAAEQLKAYDGVVNDLGRNPDVKSFLRTFFFAPKYRESIVGSQINAVKGILNFKNSNFDYSRRLAFGMGITFLAYNALNMKLNGKPMWQNAPGHEFDLAIPEKDKNGNLTGKTYYVPFMPGTTAVPRAVVGGGIALAQGDTNTAGQQLSGLLSSPLQTGVQTFLTQKDYFGRPLYNTNQPLLPQQLTHLATNLALPSSVNEMFKAGSDYMNNKPVNLPIEAARVLQMPIKEGSTPNPYFAAQQQALSSSGFDQNEQNAYNLIHPTKRDINGNLVSDNTKLTTAEKADLYYKNPKILAVDQSIAQQMVKQGQAADPALLLSPDKAKEFYQWEAMNPQNKANYAESHPYLYDTVQAQQPYFQQISQQQQKTLQAQWNSIPNKNVGVFIKNNPNVQNVVNGQVIMKQLPNDPLYSQTQGILDSYAQQLPQLKGYSANQAIADYHYWKQINNTTHKDDFAANHPFVYDMAIKEAPYDTALTQYDWDNRPQGQTLAQFTKSNPQANIKGVDSNGKVIPSYDPLGDPIYKLFQTNPALARAAILYTAYNNNKMTLEKRNLVTMNPGLVQFWQDRTNYYNQPSVVASQQQQQAQISPGLGTQFAYGGAAGTMGGAFSAGFNRNLRREFNYENKQTTTKLSNKISSMGGSGYTKYPKLKMGGLPGGNRKMIATLPKHGKSYKKHFMSSLLSYKSSPKFHKLPLPKGGRIKSVFI